MTDPDAQAIVNMLVMGLSYTEAKSVSPDEYKALITAWNSYKIAAREAGYGATS